ncbi:TPA: DUF1642 domain-containing protein [Enterococcus faecium]
MNKQELIETLEELKRNSKRCIGIDKYENYWRGKTEAYFNLIGLAKQLDEPQKPVVPKFVADWFEDNKHALDLAIFTKIRELDGKRYPHETDFENWLDNAENNPIETLIRMKDGYEVEKEPLWAIKNADGNYLTKCALWGKDGVNYSFECNPPYRLLFTDKATADAAALLVNGTVEEEKEK